MANPEQQIEQINASLKTVGDQLKSMADKADADMKARGTLDAQLRADIDKTLTTQGELQARLATAEQLLAKVQNGGGTASGPQTIGAMVTDSEDFQAFAANPKGDFRMSVQASVGSGSSSAGDLIVPDRIPGIQGPALRRLTIRDLISWGRTSSNSIEYARELVYTNNAGVVSENPRTASRNRTSPLKPTAHQS
ncbi:phage major capsid protein [Neopusillimonas aromaticivorans]|uniref:phage major capsid protein n=1 Tax=Neopusillimonas aromaticivorans TaxID=2979868 RepID=UPI002595BC9A|nr:phage major capsid protein [Neopusillimonas aromaticivorans]WJJ93433.1 phage major capsid protein [Neopusillimonas aromaticivorans]